MAKIFTGLSDIWNATKEKCSEWNTSSVQNKEYSLITEKAKSPYKWIPNNAESFESRSKRCAMGDLESMFWMFQEFRRRLTDTYKALEKKYITNTTDENRELLNSYFENHSEEHLYFQAANMWLNRAALYGSEKAKVLLEKNPIYQSEAYFNNSFQTPGNGLRKGVDGAAMKKMGFLDFDKNIIYDLDSLDSNRVYVGSCYVSYDGPDESGFGMEDEDDYYYFDEFFRLLFILRRRSTRDIRNAQDQIAQECKEKIKEQQKKRECFWNWYKKERRIV